MGIISITTDVAGQIQVNPRRIKLVTTNDLATITAAGYLNSANLQGYQIYPTDFVDCVYNYNSVTNSGTNIVLIPTFSNGIITLNSTQNVPASSSSATPGTIRALTGAMTETATVMTSGNIVGVRGSVNNVGASGGFIYGAQGKITSTGTLSGSSWSAPLFGQFDISNATINAGQTAALWGDYGSTSGTISDASGMRGVAMTNTTAAVLNAQDYRYGNATYLYELAGAGGTLNYYIAAGTSAGSAGNATHCAAQQVLKIEINGVAAYIPVFTQNT